MACKVTVTEGSAVVEFSVGPKSVLRMLFWLVVVIALTGTIANFVIYSVAPTPEHILARLMKRFDLGHEPSIPNWYSSVALLASAMLLFLISRAKQQLHVPYVRHWFGLAVLFLLLAVDEAVLIHEMAGPVLHKAMDTSGIFYFAWVIPGVLFAMLVAAMYAGFLKHLDARTRNFFLGAGAIFLSGAIGMEMVAGVVVEKAGSYEAGISSFAHTLSQGIEELLEMLGIVIFIYALLDYMSRYLWPIRLVLLRDDRES